jgi:hypothetical protein
VGGEEKEEDNEKEEGTSHRELGDVNQGNARAAQKLDAAVIVPHAISISPVRQTSFEESQQLPAPVQYIGVRLILQLQVQQIVEVNLLAEEIHHCTLWLGAERAVIQTKSSWIEIRGVK